MLVCVLSNRTSPGATSVAVGLGMVWAQQGQTPILAECDPAGGVIGLRFGMAERPSLATFASDTRRGATESNVVSNVQSLHGMQCLLGPADPRVARRAVQSAAAHIVQLHESSSEPWICDLGRIAESAAVLEIARSADIVLVVTRTSVAEVQALVYGVGMLRSQGCELGLVCIGESPNPPREIAELTDVPLYGVLPDDEAIASAFRGGQFNHRQLRKSALWRSVVHLAGEVERKLDAPRSTAAVPATAGQPAPLAPPAPAAAPAPPAPPAPAASAPPAPPAPVPAASATEHGAPAGDYGEVHVWTADSPPAAPAAPPTPAPAPAAPAAPPPAPPPPPQSTTPADPFTPPTQQNQPIRPRFDDEDDITIPRRADVSRRE